MATFGTVIRTFLVSFYCLLISLIPALFIDKALKSIKP
jgi:hypothetical protein